MGNIIDAICEVIKNPKHQLDNYAKSHNRANSMGEALEEYIKDVFAGTVNESNLMKRDQILSNSFSYLGNQNNPPDSMLIHRGDAIEVKKIESPNSALALNSSYPKAKLYADSSMINQACRDCEDWSIRDMIYAVGVVDGKSLNSLAFVYGMDYCADKEVYERIKSTIKNGVESIPNVEFAETKELGRVNRVDPLGITYLRVRGMWHIENPFKVFESIYKRKDSNSFNFMALINKQKFETLDNVAELEELVKIEANVEIIDVQIKNPNNPAKLLDAKLITFFLR